jgi:hypothetical protein
MTIKPEVLDEIIKNSKNSEEMALQMIDDWISELKLEVTQ